MRPLSFWRPTLVVLGVPAMVVALWLAPGANSQPRIPIAGPPTALQGVDCISSSDCWAVGLVVNGAGARLNQAVHFNGTKWKRVSTPDPGGKANSNGQQLTAVSCISRSDCWAVGSYLDQSSQARLDQALHWNGKRWTLVSTPQPVNPTSNDTDNLFGISCVSASNCWAVGGMGSLGAAALNQVLHWNGTKWSSVSVPEPAGKTGTVENTLRGIVCVTARDCWAVGAYRKSSSRFFSQALHFNGRRWKLVSTPSPGKSPGMGVPVQLPQLAAVACPSTTACRAVGGHPNSSGETRNEALRFDGKKWLVMSTPNPGGRSSSHTDALSGVACTAAKSCWAVGGFTAGNGGIPNQGSLNQALRWDGKKWSVAFTPNPAGKAGMDRNRLDAVTCVSSTDCWAVGTDTNAKATTASDQMLHWNGRKWKLAGGLSGSARGARAPRRAGLRSPLLSAIARPDLTSLAGMGERGLSASVPTPGTTSRLLEVSCASTSACFAVGNYGNSAGATLNEVLQWNGSRWSQVSVPQPAGKASGDMNSVFSVACTSASACWAVGNEQQTPTPTAIPPLLNEVLHWNGKQWSVSPTPQPAGTGDGKQNQLFGVTCAAARDCWATGLEGTGNASQNEALHWNGKKWRYVPTPHPGTQSLLQRDACISASDCWAAGTSVKGAGPQLNELLHWNGTKWSRASLPQPAGTSPHDGQVLAGVSCTSPSNCWATGAYAPKGRMELNQALHWNGNKWSQVSTPQPGGSSAGDLNELVDPYCVSAGKCFAAGLVAGKTGNPKNEVLDWNGTKWLAASVPQPAGTTPQDQGRPGLFGINCVSASSCWAVGTTHIGSNPFLNQVLRLRGKKWSRG